MTQSLTHLTLNTGHSRLSPRSEVSDDVIAALRPIVRAGGGNVGGIVIRCDPAPMPGGRAWSLGAVGTTAVACWCCWVDKMHEAWGQETVAAADRLGVRVSAETMRHPPRVPWLAVALLPGAERLPPDILGMFGDAERCVAWMLIEDAQAKR